MAQNQPKQPAQQGAQPAPPNALPKARFLQSNDNIKKHRDLVDSREFERGADFSLMQYTTFLATQVQDGTSAMAVGFKLQGAIEFLTQFRTLSEEYRLSVVQPTGNLDHNA